MRIHRSETRGVSILFVALLLLLPPVEAFLYQIWVNGLALYDSLSYEDRSVGYLCWAGQCTPLVVRVKKHPLLPGPAVKFVSPPSPQRTVTQTVP